MAIAVLRQGLSVVVIERTDYGGARAGEHLPPGAKPHLLALGVAGIATSDRHAACPGLRSAWGTSEPADRDYIFHPAGEALNLSRPEFDRQLASEVERLGGTLWTRTRVAGLERRHGQWRLTADRKPDSLHLTAQVLVDATGRAAAVARRLGARPIVWDRLVGLVGRTRGSQAQDRVVVIEALEEGWWYSTGLADGSVIAVFFTDPDIADLSGAGRAATWQRLSAAAPLTSGRCAALANVGALHALSARTQCLDRVCGPGWMAIGDAAQSFDPLSSQGIDKALQAGLRAAPRIAAYVDGDERALHAHQSEARAAFAEYLALRRRFYRAEMRWPDAPFWQRRHRPPVAPRGVHEAPLREHA